MRKILAALGFLLAAALPAEAALCPSIPYTFVNGATADAGQVNANFTTLLACFNNSTAHSGANSDITSLSALTAPPSGTGSLVFAGTTITNVQSGSTTAVTVGVTNPNGFALNYGNIVVFTPTVNNTTTYPNVTLAVVAAPAVNLYKWSTAGPIALTGNELQNGLVTQAIYDGTEFVLLNQVFVQVPAPIVTPGGRLTLVTATPVMGATAHTGIGTVYFTPYSAAATPGYEPVWNGTSFTNVAFTEQSQLLSDTTYSPAAAIAASCYDYFGWSPSANTYVATRGPVWSNSTPGSSSRGYTFDVVAGITVNHTSISNGPAAGYGVYLGTICTDAGGATVSYNPTPAAASGGPTGGAWVGLWNEYNRQPVVLTEQDNQGTPWTYSTATWRPSDGASSNLKNRATVVSGLAENSARVNFTCGATATSNSGAYVGIAFNSTTAIIGAAGELVSVSGSPTAGTAASEATEPPFVGPGYLQAMELGSGGGTQTFSGTGLQGSVTPQLHQLTVNWAY